MITAKALLTYFIGMLPAFGINVDTQNIDMEQTYCLAKNVYYESRGESLMGQYAVANATLNRVEQPSYPDSICEVVKFKSVSKKTNKTVCAFSWYCEPDKKDRDIVFRRKDGTIDQTALEQFQIAVIVAVTSMNGIVDDVTNGATHFHNPHISFPDWRHRLKLTLKTGNHNFYKRHDE